MHFKLELLAKYYEENLTPQRYNKPSVSLEFKKLRNRRPKLTLKEKWHLFWSDQCYPLK